MLREVPSTLPGRFCIHSKLTVFVVAAYVIWHISFSLYPLMLTRCLLCFSSEMFKCITCLISSSLFWIIKNPGQLLLEFVVIFYVILLCGLSSILIGWLEDDEI